MRTQYPVPCQLRIWTGDVLGLQPPSATNLHIQNCQFVLINARYLNVNKYYYGWTILRRKLLFDLQIEKCRRDMCQDNLGD